MIPIYDLHCDLLYYLAEKEGRGVYDPISRCSYPDLKKGGVQMQTLAIFAETGEGSVQLGMRQVDLFETILKKHPLEFAPLKNPVPGAVQVIAALEGGSCFAKEEEPLSKSLERLTSYIDRLAPLFYISLTWNTENRFGGGNESRVGLKEDGKRLLEFLDQKRIAVDLSHTSDALAYDIINWIEKKSLAIPLIASHSNFRPLSDWPRNLPEDLACEIIRRKGLIGLNFVGPFVHNTDPTVLYRHVEYALALGGENSLCFGADFFCDADDIGRLRKKYGRDSLYYPGLDNSSCYPKVLMHMQEDLKLPSKIIEQIAFGNARQFLDLQIL